MGKVENGKLGTKLLSCGFSLNETQAILILLKQDGYYEDERILITTNVSSNIYNFKQK